ncbi:hypothetical protein EPUS_08602 [Endocarpon pusillum Z07020]|uniref:SH3 domain-containing protein n=1 Tax=Endocarpon pusillum (strain Z07020 / HMAS-L-300199) TaxID=1263415 RepID=U1GLD7_ENDPU|nr:uncharacterized protein EPUS_08602 [Endocarpon pusillum Z07020]ERF73038.1 hypothetical protein EPUS_08602 [Endocarpon pusillum Z07020]
MAEVVGTIASAVTLAALFKLCVEAFDVIHTAQKQAIDLKKLTLKLNIEKCRLYTWGEAMGLTAVVRPSARQPLDSCPYAEIVHEILELILDMFGDSQKLKTKYGCVTIDVKNEVNMDTTLSQRSALQQLSTSFDNFSIKSATQVKKRSLIKTALWAIHDRKKFETLVHEVKGLIDGLQDITKDLGSLVVQEQMIRSRILRINDVRTLDWVAEICESNHPAISDAASLKAESLSEASTFRRGIQHWKENVEGFKDSDGSDTSDFETVIGAMEDMTLSEIKQITFHLLKDMQSMKTYNETQLSAGVNSDADLAVIDPSKLDFYRVLYDYEPGSKVEGGDLKVNKGDLVAVLSKKDLKGNETEWWYCRCRDGRIGYLPSNYLLIIRRRDHRQQQSSSNVTENDELRASNLEQESSAVTDQWWAELGRRADHQFTETNAMLHNIYESERSPQFKKHFGTVENWFKKLSESEQCAALVSLHDLLTQPQMCFLNLHYSDKLPLLWL